MEQTNMIEFIDANMFSYQDLSARLYSYCEKHCGGTEDLKIFFFHSEHDIGKGNAVLKLFKQFASFPVDIPISENCREIFELSEIIEHPGTALVICAWPIYSAIDDSVQPDRKIRFFPQTLSVMRKLHASSRGGLIEQQAQSAIDALSQKTAAFSDMLFGESKESLSGNVIFLSGLTVFVDSDEKASFPGTAMIPWHMSCLSGNGEKKVYEQADLTRVLGELEISSPQIDNLDRLLEEADSSSKQFNRIV